MTFSVDCRYFQLADAYCLPRCEVRYQRIACAVGHRECNQTMICSRYRGTARLDGKTAIVTGSNTGIGKTTVLDFVQRGELTCFLEC